MPTLRRILKYTPAVALGLLVVAWVTSWFYIVLLVIPADAARYGLRIQEGTVIAFSTTDDPGDWLLVYPSFVAHHKYFLGSFWFGSNVNYASIEVPAAVLVTGLLPITAACIGSFRFRLWHYLAYTAVVALELAYYLRWQE